MRRFATLVLAVVFAEAGAEGLYSHLYEPGRLSMDSVIGMEVVTPGGELLGTIREVLFDRASGRIEGIALDRSAVAYPIDALVSADSGHRLVAEPLLEAASAGASALRPAARAPVAGPPGLVIDLREGRVRAPE
jgi:sporulation protein YlmC with PRC-barrel domain